MAGVMGEEGLGLVELAPAAVVAMVRAWAGEVSAGVVAGVKVGVEVSARAASEEAAALGWEASEKGLAVA